MSQVNAGDAAAKNIIVSSSPSTTPAQQEEG
jgi:hypothetical protein